MKKQEYEKLRKKVIDFCESALPFNNVMSKSSMIFLDKKITLEEMEKRCANAVYNHETKELVGVKQILISVNNLIFTLDESDNSIDIVRYSSQFKSFSYINSINLNDIKNTSKLPGEIAYYFITKKLLEMEKH